MLLKNDSKHVSEVCVEKEDNVFPMTTENQFQYKIIINEKVKIYRFYLY